MDTILLALQWLLAAVFLMAGMMKLAMPVDKLLANPKMAWVADVGIPKTRLAGATEIMGAMGLTLPIVTGLPAILVPLAALGLATIMVLSIVTVHKPRNEPLVPSIVLGALALVVAVGRFIEPLA